MLIITGVCGTHRTRLYALNRLQKKEDEKPEEARTPIEKISAFDWDVTPKIEVNPLGCRCFICQKSPTRTHFKAVKNNTNKKCGTKGRGGQKRKEPDEIGAAE